MSNNEAMKRNTKMTEMCYEMSQLTSVVYVYTCYGFDKYSVAVKIDGEEFEKRRGTYEEMERFYRSTCAVSI